MPRINASQRNDIREAVAALEKSSGGEFVCAVAPSSARYVMFPQFWAALAALALPAANPVAAALGYGAPVAVIPDQIAVYAALAALFALTRLRVALTPHSVRVSNCRRRALEQFFTSRLHDLDGRNGLLLYVSLDERYVELIADKGINEKVGPGEWDAIVAALVADIGAGKAPAGFVKAIGACREVLARHFPGAKKRVNEIPDDLVELPPPPFIS